MSFKPYAPFTTAFKLLTPIETKKSGVVIKTFTSVDDAPVFFGAFRTFQGTERKSNDVLTIEDTATVDTWYRPDITADCRIVLCQTGKVYDIISDPENIDLRNQYLKFKVKKVGGKP